MSFQATVEVALDRRRPARLDRDSAVLGECGAVIAISASTPGGIRKPPKSVMTRSRMGRTPPLPRGAPGRRSTPCRARPQRPSCLPIAASTCSGRRKDLRRPALISTAVSAMPRLRPTDCVDRRRSIPRRGSGAVGPASAERGASLQTSDHVVKSLLRTNSRLADSSRHARQSRHVWWRPRWAHTHSPCWPRSTPPAPLWPSLAKPPPSCSASIPITRSSPVSPVWPTRPVPGCSLRSAMTEPVSPTPEP